MNQISYNIYQPAVRRSAIEDLLTSGEELNHGP